jgi:hypothetical protein
MLPDTEQLIRSLRSATCPACGGKKKAGKSLCPTDYYALNPDQRKALYQRIGRGYEAALTEALEYLGVETFHQPPPGRNTAAVQRL